MLNIKIEDGVIADTQASGSSFQIASELCAAVRNIYYAILCANGDAAEEFQFSVEMFMAPDGAAWDVSKMNGSGLCCMVDFGGENDE